MMAKGQKRRKKHTYLQLHLKNKSFSAKQNRSNPDLIPYAYNCPGGVGLTGANLILAQAGKMSIRVNHAVKVFTRLSPTYACLDVFFFVFSFDRWKRTRKRP